MTQLERFQHLIADLGACTIADIEQRLDAAGFFDADFVQHLAARARRSTIRQFLRRLKGPDGRPLWHSIVESAEEGTGLRRYKQESLFTKEDYLQAIGYAVRKGQYWQHQAEHLREGLHKRYGEQLTLPWE